jgi:hypothetical protein
MALRQAKAEHAFITWGEGGKPRAGSLSNGTRRAGPSPSATAVAAHSRSDSGQATAVACKGLHHCALTSTAWRATTTLAAGTLRDKSADLQKGPQALPGLHRPWKLQFDCRPRRLPVGSRLSRPR